jgi:hypothetical protein
LNDISIGNGVVKSSTTTALESVCALSPLKSVGWNWVHWDWVHVGW